MYANLQDANLTRANLQGAYLIDSNLQGVMFDEYTKFSEQTFLPDGIYVDADKNGKPIYDKYWTPDTDMTRYTDPKHPEFWQPDYLQPDYEGYKPGWVKQNNEKSG